MFACVFIITIIDGSRRMFFWIDPMLKAACGCSLRMLTSACIYSFFLAKTTKRDRYTKHYSFLLFSLISRLPYRLHGVVDCTVDGVVDGVVDGGVDGNRRIFLEISRNVLGTFFWIDPRIKAAGGCSLRMLTLACIYSFFSPKYPKEMVV